MSHQCTVCGRPLAWRNVRQGATVHASCVDGVAASDVEQAIDRTREVLERMSATEVPPDEVAGTDEVGELYREAAATAAQVLADLNQLKSHLGSHPARRGKPRDE